MSSSNQYEHLADPSYQQEKSPPTPQPQGNYSNSSSANPLTGNSVEFPLSGGYADGEKLKFENVNTDTLTTSSHSVSDAVMERFAIQAEEALNRLWAEAFGVLRLIFMVVVTFIRQLLRFSGWLFKNTILMTILVFGDYFVRPILYTCYTSTTYPLFVLIYACNRALLVMAQPIVQLFVDFIRPIVNIASALRLVEINYTLPQTQNQPMPLPTQTNNSKQSVLAAAADMTLSEQAFDHNAYQKV